MKKIILSILSLAVIKANAKQLPNSDFESWESINVLSSQQHPTDWNTVNSVVPSAVFALLDETCFEETGAIFGGSSALKLVTAAPPLAGYPNVNGIATTGNINTTTFAVDGGVPFTSTPDSLTGYYMGTPSGADFPTFEVVLYDANGDTCALARFEGSNSALTSYTRFSVPFVYRNSNPPAEAVALMSSSDGLNSVVGSEVLVDDLELIYNPTSIDENGKLNVKVISTLNGVEVDLTSITNEDVTYNLFDLNGKMIDTELLNAGIINLINSNVSEGVYVYQLISKSGIKSDKLLIK